MSAQREKKAGAWDAVAQLAGMIPGVEVVADGVARGTVQRLLGFWVLWHLYGGLEGIVSSRVGTRPSAYRQRTEFQHVFGLDVSEFAPEAASALVAQVAAAGPRSAS